MESLENRLLLSTVIATDLPDYAFGDVAVIYGSGFAPGETVQLQVTNVPPTGENTHSPQNDPWLVTDGGEGDLDLAGRRQHPDLLARQRPRRRGRGLPPNGPGPDLRRDGRDDVLRF